MPFCIRHKSTHKHEHFGAGHWDGRFHNPWEIGNCSHMFFSAWERRRDPAKRMGDSVQGRGGFWSVIIPPDFTRQLNFSWKHWKRPQRWKTHSTNLSELLLRTSTSMRIDTGTHLLQVKLRYREENICPCFLSFVSYVAAGGSRFERWSENFTCSSEVLVFRHHQDITRGNHHIWSS